MSVFVVDASVGVKWLVHEDHSPDARRLRVADRELHVPGFFYVEVVSVLWKKVRRGDLPASELPGIVDDLQALPLTRHPDHSLIRAALDVALATGRTVYDAVYVALAARIGGKAVTADERLYNALRGTAWEPHVLWVEDIP